MGWWITLGILALLAILPLGVSVKYDSEGSRVRVILGPVRFTVSPLRKKEKKKKKAEEPAQGSDAPKNPDPPQEAEEKKGGSWPEFLDLVKDVLYFLDVFRRKLRVKLLELKLILASDDPCDLAVNYGRTWAAVGSLMPQLERVFIIKKRDIEVECDFTASKTLVIARLDLTITLGRLLYAAVVFAVRPLAKYLKFNKKRKGGAEK